MGLYPIEGSNPSLSAKRNDNFQQKVVVSFFIHFTLLFPIFPVLSDNFFRRKIKQTYNRKFRDRKGGQKQSRRSVNFLPLACATTTDMIY